MTREEFIVKIGPEFRAIIDKQKAIVKEVTYESVNPSDYEICEILAKKIIAGKILKRSIKK